MNMGLLISFLVIGLAAYLCHVLLIDCHGCKGNSNKTNKNPKIPTLRDLNNRQQKELRSLSHTTLYPTYRVSKEIIKEYHN